jgi:hypothetical protein
MEDFGLMDYSMMVGVYRPPPGAAASELSRAGQSEEGKTALHSKAYAAQHGRAVQVE